MNMFTELFRCVRLNTQPWSRPAHSGPNPRDPAQTRPSRTLNPDPPAHRTRHATGATRPHTHSLRPSTRTLPLRAWPRPEFPRTHLRFSRKMFRVTTSRFLEIFPEISTHTRSQIFRTAHCPYGVRKIFDVGHIQKSQYNITVEQPL